MREECRPLVWAARLFSGLRPTSTSRREPSAFGPANATANTGARSPFPIPMSVSSSSSNACAPTRTAWPRTKRSRSLAGDSSTRDRFCGCGGYAYHAFLHGSCRYPELIERQQLAQRLRLEIDLACLPSRGVPGERMAVARTLVLIRPPWPIQPRRVRQTKAQEHLELAERDAPLRTRGNRYEVAMERCILAACRGVTNELLSGSCHFRGGLEECMMF